ncbi:MAG: hypothetical protein DRR11_08465 [Gammaproteobacteria bacterium]|nr:MAG: hypothetical protein DRR11_08465 [Gammaproteobacteria bacterium]
MTDNSYAHTFTGFPGWSIISSGQDFIGRLESKLDLLSTNVLFVVGRYTRFYFFGFMPVVTAHDIRDRGKMNI